FALYVIIKSGFNFVTASISSEPTRLASLSSTNLDLGKSASTPTGSIPSFWKFPWLVVNTTTRFGLFGILIVLLSSVLYLFFLFLVVLFFFFFDSSIFS